MKKSVFFKFFVIACMVVLLSAVLLSCYYSGRLLYGGTIGPAYSSDAVSEARAQGIHEFYLKIMQEKGDFSIIEYPVMVQDRYNPLYVNQSFHQKKVLNGYFLCHALKKEWRTKNILESNVWPVEILLSLMENNKINFSRLVNAFDHFINLYNVSKIRNSGSRYIILHKNIRREIITASDDPVKERNMANRPENIEVWRHTRKFTAHFREYYRRYFGAPVYEDKALVVFETLSQREDP